MSSIGTGITDITNGLAGAATGIAGSFGDQAQAAADRGSAAADLLTATGADEASSAYTTAASIAASNEALTQRGGQIQQEQEQRTITQALGTESADVAGAGFKNSGSALYLMKSSLQQGALAKQLISNSTEITAQGFAQQDVAYTGQATAATTQAAAERAAAEGETEAAGYADQAASASEATGAVSAVGGIVSGLASIFSWF